MSVFIVISAVLYLSGAVAAFSVYDGTLGPRQVLVFAAFWPFWPLFVVRDELSIWLASREYDREIKRRNAERDAKKGGGR